MIDQHILQVLKFSPDIQAKAIAQKLPDYTTEEITTALDRLIDLAQVATYQANVGRKQVTRYRMVYGTLGEAIQAVAARIEKHDRWALRMRSDLATIEAKAEELRDQYHVLRAEQLRLRQAIPGNQGWAA